MRITKVMPGIPLEKPEVCLSKFAPDWKRNAAKILLWRFKVYGVGGVGACV